MVNVDGSLFIQIINFLFLIWILNAVMYRPVRNVLRRRKEKIGGIEKEIETFAKDAKQKKVAFSDGIKAARVKGIKEKDILAQAAADEEKAIIGKISEKAQADLAKSREKIAQEAEEVRKTLMKDMDGFANEISRKILGRAV
ncbi:MAG: ATPase [Desulfobacteraceae bacterium IS3]|nr:MAG: ATPase [Desulfobacteraceae bacterium IS3]